MAATGASWKRGKSIGDLLVRGHRNRAGQGAFSAVVRDARASVSGWRPASAAVRLLSDGASLFPDRFARRKGQPFRTTHPGAFLGEAPRDGRVELMPGITAEEFAQRRARVAARLPTGAVLIAAAPDTPMMAHDVPHNYRTCADVAYLTGYLEPGTVVAIESLSSSSSSSSSSSASTSADGSFPTLARASVVVKDVCAGEELWHGPRTGLADAAALLEVEACEAEGPRGNAMLRGLIESASVLLHDSSEAVLKAISAALGPSGRRPARQASSREFIDAERVSKSPAEVALLARACSKTARAVSAVMGSGLTRSEAHVAARFRYEAAMVGATGLAFPPVVASGANALCLHYLHADMPMAPDALVMVDMGLDYHMYCGDVSRAWPVSGSFTDAQRDLYGTVLEIEEACIRAVSDGQVGTLRDLHVLSLQLTVSAVARLFSISARRAAQLVPRLYPHSIGHYLGLDTHDAHTAPQDIPFPNRCAFTIEPGIYVGLDCEDAPAEMRGQGLRIEDDILAIDGEVKVLTSEAPKSIQDVERIVSEGIARRSVDRSEF